VEIYDADKRYCDIAKRLGVPCRLSAVAIEADVLRKLGALMRPQESLAAIKQYLKDPKVGLAFFGWERVTKVLETFEWTWYATPLNLGIPLNVADGLKEKVLVQLGSMLVPPMTILEIMRELRDPAVALSFFRREPVFRMLESDEWNMYVAKLSAN
jgi:hypothetical protein